MTETFDGPDASTLKDVVEILQVYVGVALILLGILLTGIAVQGVMSLFGTVREIERFAHRVSDEVCQVIGGHELLRAAEASPDPHPTSETSWP